MTGTFRREELAIEDAGGQRFWGLGARRVPRVRSAGRCRRTPAAQGALSKDARWYFRACLTFRNGDMHSDRGIVADWGRAVQIVTGPEIQYTIDIDHPARRCSDYVVDCRLMCW